MSHSIADGECKIVGLHNLQRIRQYLQVDPHYTSTKVSTLAP